MPLRDDESDGDWDLVADSEEELESDCEPVVLLLEVFRERLIEDVDESDPCEIEELVDSELLRDEVRDDVAVGVGDRIVFVSERDGEIDMLLESVPLEESVADLEVDEDNERVSVRESDAVTEPGLEAVSEGVCDSD